MTEKTFGLLLKTSADEGKEKHVPIIECPTATAVGEPFAVSVTVGKEIAHPNTAEHHIKWIQVFAREEGKNPVHLMTFDAGPGHGEPKITFSAKLERPSVLYALSYCNIHGLWENSAEIKVS